MKTVTILGSTGSIGVNTLDVIARHPDKYRVAALTANTRVEELAQQCIKYRPDYAVMVDPECARKLAELLRTSAPNIQVLDGTGGLETVAALDEVDYVMAAIVGAAGLLPTLAAARAGKRVLLANKEALVMSGQLFKDAIESAGAELLPIDSEHNAIFQCMPSGYRDGLAQAGVSKILLTASGGPFRTMPLSELHKVTPDQACAHPNWDMGRKISVDSATMMNKGLEVIEACWLFDTEPASVQVVIHPQSVIHSMVQYIDGSVLAQLGNPDMRTPIAHALAWPERMEAGVTPLDIFTVARLDFETPDLERFPCLALAAAAMAAGKTSTAILNAANEVAVASFLAGHIPFTEIPATVEATLDKVAPHPADSLENILASDREARTFAESRVREIAA
ncbi:MAG: 1-deoxy-D-xylulose-5-phosphate reductoisomerase [Gammaproteobacteria bacterium]|nr:1-deoxy-D-xylulose-5-phosphate reductoisomerase [Gammaproteobacteria bacterium]